MLETIRIMWEGCQRGCFWMIHRTELFRPQTEKKVKTDHLTITRLHHSLLELIFCCCWFFFFCSVPANLRSLVYFYGVRNGGVKEWNFLFEQFQKSSVASERQQFLFGLAGASEPWLLNRCSTCVERKMKRGFRWHQEKYFFWQNRSRVFSTSLYIACRWLQLPLFCKLSFD